MSRVSHSHLIADERTLNSNVDCCIHDKLYVRNPLYHKLTLCNADNITHVSAHADNLCTI